MKFSKSLTGLSKASSLHSFLSTHTFLDIICPANHIIHPEANIWQENKVFNVLTYQIPSTYTSLIFTSTIRLTFLPHYNSVFSPVCSSTSLQPPLLVTPLSCKTWKCIFKILVKLKARKTCSITSIPMKN